MSRYDCQPFSDGACTMLREAFSFSIFYPDVRVVRQKNTYFLVVSNSGIPLSILDRQLIN